jgi:hypothetical protein
MGQGKNREPRGEDAMSTVFFLSNYYDGPLKGQGHGQGPKPGNPGHPWHWLKEANQSWESMPLVAGKPQHFEIAPQAIRHARDHGFEVHYNHPEFKTAFAVKP